MRNKSFKEKTVAEIEKLTFLFEYAILTYNICILETKRKNIK